jgi:hypothetical protein
MQFEVETGSPENFTWNTGIDMSNYEGIHIEGTHYNTLTSSMNLSRYVRRLTRAGSI